MDENTADNIKQFYRYKYIIENIKDIIWEMDPNMVFTFMSPTSREMTGFDAEELIGKCMLDFLSSKSREKISEQWKRKIGERVVGHSTEPFFLDVQFICKSGRNLWVEVSGKPIFNGDEFIGYIGTSRDISEKKIYENKLGKYIKELKHANVKLEELATYDMLTGAYNRRKFEKHIKTAIDMKEKYDCTFSIMLFDIDYFKKINDLYGHNKGDQILKEITAVVKYTVRDTDMLFRWGGDEFIILLPGTAQKDAYKVAEKVRSSIEANSFGAQVDKVTISLGVGEYIPGFNIEQYVSYVDSALLKAKADGRNRVECILE